MPTLYPKTGKGFTYILGGSNGSLSKTSYSDILLSQATGTAICGSNMSNPSVTVDGNLSQVQSACCWNTGGTSSANGWGNAAGRQWPTAKIISKFTAYAPSNAGFLRISSPRPYKMRLLGSNTNDPTTASVLWESGTRSGVLAEIVTITMADGINISTPYLYHWVDFYGDGTYSIAIAELVFYELLTTTSYIDVPLEPISPEESETWFNPFTNQVKIFTGVNWKLLWQDFGGLYGYVIGGLGNYSTIEKISYPFNSGNVIISGNMNYSGYGASTFNSSTHGYAAMPYVAAISSIIHRLVLPEATSSIQCSLAVKSSCVASAMNSSQFGYMFGGNNPSGNSATSQIQKLIFALDTANATVVANTSITTQSGVGFNSSTHGYTTIGWNGTAAVSSLERITFASDSSATNLIAAALTIARQGGLNGINSSQFGFVCGGVDTAGTTYYSTIDKAVFPYSSGSMSSIGTLSGSKFSTANNNSSQHGFVCGGHNGSLISTIDRFSFPFDTGVSSNVGSLTIAKRHCNGIDTTDFLAQFV